jgi:Zn-finger nucleic acid-binding protein
MLCPNCQVEMREVNVPSKYYDQPIVLDQCVECGGIWFDRWEAYQVSDAEALELDELDIGLLQREVPVKTKGLSCPRCGTGLSRFNDSLMPNTVILAKCNKCDGLWMNRGTLTGFIGDRRKKKEELKKEAPVVVKPEVEQGFLQRANDFMRPRIPSMQDVGVLSPKAQNILSGGLVVGRLLLGLVLKFPI